MGLFKKIKSPVSKEDTAWLMENANWLIENFGYEDLIQRPVVDIESQFFPNLRSGDSVQLKGLLTDLCGLLEINEAFIDLELVEKKASTMSSMDIVNVDHTQRFYIRLQDTDFNNLDLLVASLLIELAKIKVHQCDIELKEEFDHSVFIYLLCSYYGFAKILARTHLENVIHINKDGISLNHQGFIQAYLLWVCDRSIPDWIQNIQPSLKNSMERSFEFFNRFEDIQQIQEGLRKKDIDARQIKDAWDTYQVGHTNLAVTLISEIIHKSPNDPYLYTTKGFFLVQSKKPEEGLPFLKQALEIDPQFGDAFTHIGYAYLLLNQPSWAYENLRSAEEINPHNAYLQRNLGLYYLNTGKTRDALKHFDIALRINPNIELIHFYTGLAKLENKDISGGMAELEFSANLGETEAKVKLKEFQKNLNSDLEKKEQGDYDE